ncbi:spt3 [Colletotrichum tabaci]|uniref:Spt3 n=1 Tax=Colletotrichum tabaci TaxID=1209068 RepID=A0AAV9TGG1_9PEZI
MTVAMEDRELQAFLTWRSHYDQDSGGCHMKDLIGSLETSLGILEQCTEPLADGATDTDPDIVPGKSTYIRPSRAKAAVAARIQRESTELFQSAFDEVRGITVVSGYQPILDIRIGEEHQQAKGKRSGSSKLKSQPDFAIRRPEKGDKRSYGWNDRFTNVLCKMMYVSGETAEPSVETTSMIEDIVRQQVIELLRNCTELAARRGARAITINDLIFQIRHDQAKVSRLRTFLSWKDVRKNVKDSDDKGGEADLGAGEDPVGGVVPGGPVDDATKKNKKAKVGLPWEPLSFYSQEVPERDDEEDEEEEEMNFITLQRLRKADERTKAMTKEEYVTWSEYRQASFTYRKGKRFREWAGFGIVTDSKPSDDIVDILGFLTFEMVQTLTEHALKVKEQEDLFKAQSGGENAGSKKRKVATGLFDPPSEGRSPIEPRHVQEAFRRLQQRPKKTRAMLNGSRLPQHTALNIF